MTKIGELSVQMKRTDKAMSEYVRAKTPFCVLCGSRERLTAGHLISRVAKSVRFSLDNVFTQCSSCNFLHEHRPERFTQWWIQRFGVDAYNGLVAHSKETRKWTVPELRELEQEFKRMKEAL